MIGTLMNLRMRRAAARADALIDGGDDDDAARHVILAALVDLDMVTDFTTLHRLASAAMRISEGPGTAMHEVALRCFRRARAATRGGRKGSDWRLARENLASRLIEELVEADDEALAGELYEVATELVAGGSRARNAVEWASAQELLAEACEATGRLREALAARRESLDVMKHGRLPSYWQRPAHIERARDRVIDLLLVLAKEGDRAAAAEAVALIEERLAEDPEYDPALDPQLALARKLC